MIERWLKLKPFILIYDRVPAPHTDEDWVIMQDIICVLKGYRASQLILEGEKYVTSSLMPICIHKLQKELRKVICSSNAVKTAVPLVLNDLYTRYGKYNLYFYIFYISITSELIFLLFPHHHHTFAGNFQNSVYGITDTVAARQRIIGVPKLNFHGLFLDPRVKKMSFLTEIDREAIRGDVVKIISKPSFQLTPPDGVVVIDEEETAGPMANEECDDYFVSDDEIVTPEDEVTRYLSTASIAKTADPLQWWRLNYMNYPRLANYARAVLAIPATSAPCERLFSEMGDVITDKRNRLTPNNACDEVLVAESQKFVEKYREEFLVKDAESKESEKNKNKK